MKENPTGGEGTVVISGRRRISIRPQFAQPGIQKERTQKMQAKGLTDGHQSPKTNATEFGVENGLNEIALTMNSKMSGLLKAISVGAACFSFLATSNAAVVYNNDNSLAITHNFTGEQGDQIRLTDGIDNREHQTREVATFSWTMFTELTALEGRNFTLRFYENNGVGGVPERLLYNSGAQPLNNGYETLSLEGLSVVVPDTFTWTIEFSGLAVGEKAGLIIANPPSVGASPNDFWAKIGNVWTLNQLGDGSTPANFAARVVAVPEPGVIALVLLGGGALLASRVGRKSRA